MNTYHSWEEGEFPDTSHTCGRDRGGSPLLVREGREGGGTIGDIVHLEVGRILVEHVHLWEEGYGDLVHLWEEGYGDPVH